jgi:hypothetical protein
MLKIIAFTSLFLSSYSILAQITIPLSSFTDKVKLMSYRLSTNDTTLYATVYSDTINNNRLWIFNDTTGNNNTAKSILLEIFNNQKLIRKQIFLSDITSVIKSDSEWEMVEFMKYGYGNIDSKFLKFLKKEISLKFPKSLRQIVNLFNKNSLASIRESNYSLNGQWQSALQTSAEFYDYGHSNWMILEPYEQFKDMIKITQKWNSSTYYNIYHLNRTTIKNRLTYMEAVFNDYSTNFRRYEYGNDLKLKQIIEGRLVNDSEDIEHIILVVPY